MNQFSTKTADVRKQENLLTTAQPTAECRLRNDRQSYFAITRALVQAQFVLADGVLSQRLWQEVADRDLEVGRILNLLYSSCFQDDEAEMTALDDAFLALHVS
ncbi:MAG: hypothetical protein ISQ53_05120 [Synechococcus sp. BS307-5m-G39]|nr:hypothetical protein [Synechococcus sp. BS307-5m-G39]MBL6800839.1 hypothetical protein [Synechococcus sp. BS307-5m-G37]